MCVVRAPEGEYTSFWGPYNVLVLLTIAPESPDYKSAGCQAVTLGKLKDIHLFREQS